MAKNKALDFRGSTFNLFCLFVFIGLLALGTWQVKRLLWKQELLATIEAHTHEPAIVLPSRKPLLADNLDFRTIKASGHFLHRQEIIIRGKYMGTKQGAYLITPLELTDGSLLLVNRGWVPKESIDVATRPDSQPKENHTLKGMVWVFDKPFRYLPKNKPQENLWLWATKEDLIPYFQSKNPGANVLPVLVAQTEPFGVVKEGGLPVIPEKNIHIKNDHLQYAITWYLLALIIAVMTILHHRKRR